jgi:hypothetical protein
MFLTLFVTTLVAHPVSAAILRADATCSAIAEIMDGTDRQQIGYAVQIIADFLTEADKPFVQRKRGSVVNPLSDDGLTGIVALTITRCRANPTEKVRDTAQGVYAGLRAMQAAVGNVR